MNPQHFGIDSADIRIRIRINLGSNPGSLLVKISALAAVGAVVQLVEYRTRNREVAGSTHTRSTASNLE